MSERRDAKLTKVKKQIGVIESQLAHVEHVMTHFRDEYARLHSHWESRKVDATIEDTFTMLESFLKLEEILSAYADNLTLSLLALPLPLGCAVGVNDSHIYMGILEFLGDISQRLRTMPQELRGFNKMWLEDYTGIDTDIRTFNRRSSLTCSKYWVDRIFRNFTLHATTLEAGIHTRRDILINALLDIHTARHH